MKIGTVEVNGLMVVPDKMPVTKEKTEGGWILAYENCGIRSYYGGHDIDLDEGKVTLYFFEDPARAFLFESEEDAGVTLECGNEPGTDILVKLSRPRMAGELTGRRTGKCSRD